MISFILSANSAFRLSLLLSNFYSSYSCSSVVISLLIMSTSSLLSSNGAFGAKSHAVFIWNHFFVLESKSCSLITPTCYFAAVIIALNASKSISPSPFPSISYIIASIVVWSRLLLPPKENTFLMSFCEIVPLLSVSNILKAAFSFVSL